MIGEYILLGVLLLAALFLVVAVTMQKSGDEGLSGTIAGGSETYYGKDKSARREKILGKWTLIVALVFALVVLVVYVIQPDYPMFETEVDSWKNISGISEFSYLFS
ncbi:MAG: preprotein translocase subunit SecG [Clostridia bacterium]|nr:preprotein translocase subunit SecG [Clostridia bacterium]